MNNKGSVLISQNNNLTAENQRLETINKDLQETIRFMDTHLTKMLQENSDNRKNYLLALDEKRLEIDTLNEQLRQADTKSRVRLTRTTQDYKPNTSTNY